MNWSDDYRRGYAVGYQKGLKKVRLNREIRAACLDLANRHGEHEGLDEVQRLALARRLFDEVQGCRLSIPQQNQTLTP